MDKLFEKISIELKEKLMAAVQKHRAEGILFSGGLDSSILALLSPQASLFSVSLESYGEDLNFARLTAKYLRRKHHIAQIETREALTTIPKVIGILKTFDLALPNDLATYFALRLAKEKGISSVITGDGADELFCGYSYMFNIDLEAYLPHLAKRMHFSSPDLGKTFGIKVKQPFLDKEFIEFALRIPPNLKVMNEKTKTWGKWILRKAFADDLPQQILWQEKRPIELGSGFNTLRKIIESRIPHEKFQKRQKKYSIKFLNREHFYYYEIYRNVVGEISRPQEGQAECPFCGAGMDKMAFHCRTCGRSKENPHLRSKK